MSEKTVETTAPEQGSEKQTTKDAIDELLQGITSDDSTGDEGAVGVDNEQGEQSDEENEAGSKVEDGQAKGEEDEEKNEEVDPLIQTLNEFGQANLQIDAEGSETVEDGDGGNEESNEPTPVDFLGNLDIDDVLESKESLNNVLKNVFEANMKAIKQLTLELPKIVSNIAQQYTDMQLTVRDFYQKNPDLAPLKPFVGVVAQHLGAKNPDWSYDKLLEETGKEVRSRLKKLKGSGSEAKPRAKQKATFQQPNGTRLPSLSSEGLQKEIDELLDF